ncbi:unannotated protein [freshwater metagenome]|uniref:Unannotated protein n=1 Tax=freshwater metagenome TaxID=449393 RepID=A0A6J7GN02_9ZZZZ|nr:hypothetical protein [Actinomycetota bacterium]
MKKQYSVLTHEANFTPPDFGSLLQVGEFDTAEEAIACLKRSIDKQLMESLNDGKTPKEAYDQFSLYGEVPIIDGEPRVYVQPYEYAQKRVKELVHLKVIKKLDDYMYLKEQEELKSRKKTD